MLSDLIGYLADKRLLVWGLGTEGLSTLRFLRKHLPGISVVVADGDFSRVETVAAEYPTAEALAETEALARIEEFDLILKSPGIPLHKYALHLGIKEKIRGQTELFLRFAPGRVIGITGTKGKSTTSSLIAHLLSTAEVRLPLVGNIGIPAWDVWEDLKPDSTCIVELSSYQLEGAEHSPTIAVLLNLFQEHLNYHGTLDAYWTAKWNIARYQQPGDFLVYNAVSKEIKAKLGLVPSGVNKIPFARDFACPFSLLGAPFLRGKHNLQNVQAAVEVARILAVPDQVIRERILTFQGLPHRLEFLGIYGGITYYNDSISTVPESAMAALDALPETETMILGGQNRGVNYTQLAGILRQSNLGSIILVSETGAILRDLLKGDRRVSHVQNLSDAIKIAKKRTAPGKTCLFSPAAPSYNQFRNFEERGGLFKKLVQG